MKKLKQQYLSQCPLACSPDPVLAYDAVNEAFYLGRFARIKQQILQRLRTLKALQEAPQEAPQALQNQLPCCEDTSTQTHQGESHSSRQIKALAVLKQYGWLAICGGAGTGKSTLALSLVEQLQSLMRNDSQPLKVICVAPTGKAVARLAESLQTKAANSTSVTSTSSNEANTAANLAMIETKTIHAALGKQPGRHASFNGEHRLDVDMVVVDEVSMVEWQLAYELIQALPSHAVIIFMGDINQLPAIGVSGFYDMVCQEFPQHTLTLRQQYRFDEHSDIHRLAQLALNDQLFSTPLESPHWLPSWVTSLSGQSQSTMHTDAAKLNQALQRRLQNWIDDQLAQPLQQLQQQLKQQQISMAKADEVVLQKLLNVAVISPWREKIQGVNHLNRIIHDYLQRIGLLTTQRLSEGMPIILRRNLHHLGLYNGDRGVVVWVEQRWMLRLPNSPKCYPLPDPSYFDLAYAMTVYQTQGSEFDTVLLWLGEITPQKRQWLDRRLLYTSITRARKDLTICGVLMDKSPSP